MFCSKCGKEIDDAAVVCTGCGCPTQNYQKESQQAKTAYTFQQPSQEMLCSQKISNIHTLGIIALIGGLFFVVVAWICGGIGLYNASTLAVPKELQSRYEEARKLNIIGIAVPSVLWLIGFFAIFGEYLFW